MMIVLVRTIILYCMVLFVIRVMGKSELSSMQPFQLVITLMIADIAAVPIESPDTSLFNGVAALIALLFIQVIVSYVTLKNDKIRTFICGKPSYLIYQGELDKKELINQRMSLTELKEQLRLKGYPLISDVDYAIIETNGDLSVIPKDSKKPLTVEDYNKMPNAMHLMQQIYEEKENQS